MGFAEEDQSYSEGRDMDDLFLQKDVTDEDILVTILLRSVDGFEDYRTTTMRPFSADVINRIEQIPVQAECEFS